MRFKREITQVRNTIKRLGYGEVATLFKPQDRDPVTGIPVGYGGEISLYSCVANYSREDLANPSIANGLLKILVTPLAPNGLYREDLISWVENKNTTVTLNGKRYSITAKSVTAPDSKTVIVARLFLGG